MARCLLIIWCQKCGLLPSSTACIYVPLCGIAVFKIPLPVICFIEIEDTSEHLRGDKEFVRVIAECENGRIVGIDMREIKMGRPSVGSEMLPAITVPEELRVALEKKAVELGISVPDARREAYRLFTK